MEYQNRLPPDGINTPGRHPLKEFFRLLVFALVALVSIGLLLNFAGGHLGGAIPYKMERWVTSRIHNMITASGEPSPFAPDPIDSPLKEYLDKLADQVQVALEMEAPMEITLHYSDEDTVNAYATIGGHVYLFNGLLRQLPHENSLVMLMAHEFAHVQLRHTARGVGSGLAVAIGMAVLPGDSSLNSPVFGFANRLTSMQFSRGMETGADKRGLFALEKIYGHVNGADDLFELFMLQRGPAEQKAWGAFLSTHPLNTDRIETIASFAMDQGWAMSGELTALPEEFNRWLSAE